MSKTSLFVVKKFRHLSIRDYKFLVLVARKFQNFSQIKGANSLVTSRRGG